jgi:hypothetical protein
MALPKVKKLESYPTDDDLQALKSSTAVQRRAGPNRLSFKLATRQPVNHIEFKHAKLVVCLKFDCRDY